MGRFSYQFQYQPPYYANQAQSQAHGWPAAARQSQVSPPPPYVDHQSAKKVRNDVNVHKHTLKIEVDEENPDHVLVSFVFDALFDGRLVISFFLLPTTLLFQIYFSVLYLFLFDFIQWVWLDLVFWILF